MKEFEFDDRDQRMRKAAHECGHLLVAYLLRGVIRPVDLDEDEEGEGAYNHEGLPNPEPLPPGLDPKFLPVAISGLCTPALWEYYRNCMTAWQASDRGALENFCAELERLLEEEVQIALGGEAGVLALDGDRELARKGTVSDRTRVIHLMGAWERLTGCGRNTQELETWAAESAFRMLVEARETLCQLTSALWTRGQLGVPEIETILATYPPSPHPTKQ